MASCYNPRKVAETHLLVVNGGAMKLTSWSVGLKFHLVVADPVHALPWFGNSSTFYATSVLNT